MKFVVYENGTKREVSLEEAHNYLSEMQIWDAIQAKQDDPLEEVSYMIPGGVIVIE